MPPTTLPDEEVLAAVRALQAGGGPDAFNVIFRRYYRSLHTFFVNRPALREQADDLTQIALIRAYQSIGQFRFESNFETWLRTIGENVWKNAVRDGLAAKRMAHLETLDMTAEEEGGSRATASQGIDPPDGTPGPEARALAHERTRVLAEALAALPPGMRQLMELRVLQELKYQEIADVTGVGLNTVRSQLFEARKRLQPVLDRYFHGAEI